MKLRDVSIGSRPLANRDTKSAPGGWRSEAMIAVTRDVRDAQAP